MITLTKTIVLVGLMGAGKSAIGKRLAEHLSVVFVDSDEEIEKQQGCTINEIFAAQGESAFRQMERDIILHDLKFPPHILAVGGGAFIQPETRRVIKENAISIWLKAELDVLLERVERKNTRPLLEQGDKREILEKLMEIRYPLYAEADITVCSGEGAHHEVVQRIEEALKRYAH